MCGTLVSMITDRTPDRVGIRPWATEVEISLINFGTIRSG